MARVLRVGERRPVVAVVVVLVVYVLVWSGLDWVSSQFPAAPGVSLWYVPAAVDVLLLLLFGVRWVPVLAVTVTIHSTLIAAVGLRWWQVAILAVVMMASYGGAAAVLIRRTRFDTRLPTLRDVAQLLVVMCVLAPLPVALVQVGLLRGAGAVGSAQFVTGVAGYWAGSTTGAAMLVPLVLVVARRVPRRGGSGEGVLKVAPAYRPGRRERVAQLVVLVAAVWVGYATGGGSLDYSYLVYVPLVWIALRGGFTPAAVAVLVINVGAVTLNQGDVPAQGVALQFGLVTVTVLGVLLGAAVSQRQHDAATDREAALHDPLTGLGNRVLLGERATQLLTRRAAHGTDPGGSGGGGGLLFVDLDEFKQINDSLGHAAGDEVLIEVARRLVAVTRPVDTVTRLGGDEFAVLLDDLDDGASLSDTAGRILAAVTAPVQIDAGLVHVTASIGSATLLTAHPVTPYPSRSHHRDPGHATADRDGEEVVALLQRADVALHRAKDQGRNQHVSFAPDQLEHARRRRDREQALREALGRHDVTAVFQPVVDAHTGRLVAAEALARWSTRAGAVVSPQEFIATAEDSGLIAALGESMLTQACRAAAGWGGDAAGVAVAVNVSALELHRPDYAETVLGVLAETGLPAHRLELEVTETQWVNEAVVSSTSLRTLTDAGVQVVLDDFGTGYSSFRHLADLPVAGIKIDRSFVAAAPGDPRNTAVVRAILCMATELGLTATAEGVETHEQWNFLTDAGATYVQGFLIGHPHVAQPTSRTPPPR